MKTIPLTKGLFATVDDEDHEWLSKRKWRLGGTNLRPIAVTGCRKNKVCMHRAIMGVGFFRQVIHLDGNRLNNQKSNLVVGKKPSGHRMPTKAGYVLVKCSHPKSTKGCVLEHRLVMETHIGRLLTDEEVVHHRNENKGDNRIENLQLCANEQEHRLIHLLKYYANGEGSPNSKVTPAKILEIREAYHLKKGSQRQLARQYGVSQPVIGCIVRRETWKHI